MAKIRIYELARELGVDNKAVILKAQELGMPGKLSHSNSLEESEAEQLRRAFIRAAVSPAPQSTTRVVKKQVDVSTGETRTIIESRKGNVVRRRRQSEPEVQVKQEVEQREEEEIKESTVEVALESREDTTEKDQVLSSGVVPTEVVVGEEVSESIAQDEEGSSEALLEEEVASAAEKVISESEVVEDLQEEDSSAEDEAAEEEQEVSKVEDVIKRGVKKVIVGPKILGKIELPQKKKKGEKSERGERTFEKGGPVASQYDESIEDDEDEEGGRRQGGGKKRSRKREFTRGQLVDYDGRPGRRRGPKDAKGKGEQVEKEEAVVETQPQRASKRVVKMATDVITVGELARQMSLKVAEVISKLMQLGVMATINQAVDSDTAAIVADEFGFTIEFTGFDEEEILMIEPDTADVRMELRSPVVTVMGHVDHGKTSLLDAIRKTSVAAREHGGITQHVGAYKVKLPSNRSVVFIDTPGHAAFTQMRARGAEVTDIVIIVVAADDGVMPQTIEAINHAKAANVSICVAINKMDKPEANPDKVKQQLAERGLQPEDWGGDVMMFPVSAATREGIPELLEGLLLLAEIKELKANVTGRAKGTIIESRQERGRGTVVTLLVQSGCLKIGDIYVCGAEYGRVRALYDDRQNRIEEAGPSDPVELSGLYGVPMAGDDFIVVENEQQAKQVATNRKQRKMAKDQLSLAGGPISLEEFARRAGQEQALELNIIIKTDVHGTLEAITESVEKLSTQKVKVRVLHGGVGAITESDVQLALASKAIIVGFGVRAEPRTINEAESVGVELRFYRVIYELLDDVKLAMAGLLDPIKKEVSLARAEVRDTFVVPKTGTVAGCYVLNGTVKRGARLRLLRDNNVIHEGKMLSLRRFKDDVKEVAAGYECGISFVGYNDIKVSDIIEVYEIEEVAATLE
ncbi:MAG: translation initiation factor IF-2 [Bdellovibrionota bacterium]|jgi:translation initiation factor IF-2